MKKLTLYQIAVLLHPEEKSKDSTELIVEPHYKLAVNDKIAAQIAIRSLDDKYESMLERIEILVRPF
jgi:hypothetical protein